MKFPRNARIFRGQLDAAPFAAVFFLLVIFLMLSSLVYTPGGLRLELPVTENLPGSEHPTVAVAIDANGRLYYENQEVGEDQLRNRLHQVVTQTTEPLTLLVQADKAVTYERLVRVSLLARQAGIGQAWLATLPGPLVPRP